MDIALAGKPCRNKVMRFARKLSKLIDDAGLSQTKLARASGIGQTAISDMTMGKRRPYMDQALLLARALGVSLDFLADDDLDEPPAPELTEEEQSLLRLVREIGPELARRRLLLLPEDGPAVDITHEVRGRPLTSPGQRDQKRGA